MPHIVFELLVELSGESLALSLIQHWRTCQEPLVLLSECILDVQEGVHLPGERFLLQARLMPNPGLVSSLFLCNIHFKLVDKQTMFQTYAYNYLGGALTTLRRSIKAFFRPNGLGLPRSKSLKTPRFSSSSFLAASMYFVLWFETNAVCTCLQIATLENCFKTDFFMIFKFQWKKFVKVYLHFEIWKYRI